jgi:glycosyltransferase involved in cell wall biosynthesis
MRLGVLATHPIQYHAPLYRALAQQLDLTVFFAHQQTAQGQADAGFGVAFEWDVPLLDGYTHRFLNNRALEPSTQGFRGCDTPGIGPIIAEERFDAFLVNGWYNKSFWQAIRACWGTGTPLLVRGDSQLHTPRRWALRMAKELVYRTFIPRFDGYLVVGTRAREYYSYYGARPERMFFVPHFVDNAYFAAQAARLRPEREDLRTRYGIREASRVFLFAGKFIPEKNPVDFVTAVAVLAQRHPDVEGVMVGDGALRPEIEAEVERTGAPVHLLGFFNQSQMPKAYALADALVLPSQAETWGLVVNEAMASGRPVVVSSAVGCAPDLVDEGRTGHVFAPGDIKGLCSAMERTLRMIRDTSLEEALAHRMNRFSLETAIHGTIRAVRGVQERSDR